MPGEELNRKVSGRSTSKDVAGGRAHLDHVGPVNMGQGFTRKPRTMAKKSGATLRIARHWKAQLQMEARNPAASSGGSPSRLMHLQKELSCRFDRDRRTKELRRSEAQYDSGHKVTGL
jgi:hypothetical protein